MTKLFICFLYMCHYNEVVGFSHFAPYFWNKCNILPPTHVRCHN